MAARAAELGDVGESSPEHWETPLGTADVHVALAALVAGRGAAGGARSSGPRSAHEELPGVEVIWRQDCYQLPTGRTSFGFKDGIGQPAIEGSGMPAVQPAGAAAQGGRVHPRLPGRDRRAAADAEARRARPQRHLRRLPQAAHPGRGLPAVPAREGREPRGRGAARRQDGRTLAERRAARALARSATIPSSAPTRSATTTSSTATIRAASSARPARTRGARTRATRSIDDGSVDVRLHRMIRRGTSYGPMLPEGVLEDDGADRGIIFVFAGAHLEAPVRVRQDAVAQRRHLHRRPGREGPARRTERRDRQLHDSAAADPPPAAGPAALRRHPRRRVLLRPGPARAALARGARRRDRQEQEQEDT